MKSLCIYYARAIDALPENEVIRAEQFYVVSLGGIGCEIINKYRGKSENIPEDAPGITSGDWKLLETADLLLADLSVPDYQYVGCLFEIVWATQLKIPVVLVVGESDLAKRVYFQAYCDFIVQDKESAIEFISRAHTDDGINDQMAETMAYHDSIAHKYGSSSLSTHQLKSREEEVVKNRERDGLRALIGARIYGKVCQIGPGTGDWTAAICKKANSVIAIEQSKAMIAAAEENLKRSNITNCKFHNTDVFDLDSEFGDLFDCIVLYFFLSLLPARRQQTILSWVGKRLAPNGTLVLADTRKLGDIPARGLGPRQLQTRNDGLKDYTIYKEHFVGSRLRDLAQANGFSVIGSDEKLSWFSWVCARPVCNFCDKFGGRNPGSGDSLFDRILWQDSDFVIVPAQGSLTAGYVMIVPKIHFLSVAELPDVQIRRLVQLKSQLYDQLSSVFNVPVFFEHGMLRPSEGAGGACIGHAHLHCVPLANDITHLLETDQDWMRIDDYWELSDHVKHAHSYMYIENQNREGFLSVDPEVPGQYFRRLLAKELGIADEWDWAAYSFEENARKTVARSDTFDFSFSEASRSAPE